MGISRLLSCHISWKYGPDYAILECRMEFYRNFRHSAYPDCSRPMFRATDIVGRTGGDEFMVFLKDIREISMIEREGRKIEQFFHQFEVGEYVKYSVTASVGAAVFPGDGKSFEELYKAADNALYVSKRHGKNQLSFYKKPENETK